jgi:hypothetical protein
MKYIYDIGAGDCGWVFGQAASNPDNFYVAIEPSEKSFVKTAKKQNKRKLNNFLIINKAIENIEENDFINNTNLIEKADEIYINYPWAKLLEGIVNCDINIWRSIFNCCRDEAEIFISINPLPWEDRTPDRLSNIPSPNKDYFESTLEPFLQKNFNVSEVNYRVGSPKAVTKWIKHVDALGKTINILIKQA